LCTTTTPYVLEEAEALSFIESFLLISGLPKVRGGMGRGRHAETCNCTNLVKIQLQHWWEEYIAGQPLKMLLGPSEVLTASYIQGLQLPMLEPSLIQKKGIGCLFLPHSSDSIPNDSIFCNLFLSLKLGCHLNKHADFKNVAVDAEREIP
jgi:hypothetical protein